LYVFGLLFAPSKSVNHPRHREKPTQIAQEDGALHCCALLFAHSLEMQLTMALRKVWVACATHDLRLRPYINKCGSPALNRQLER